MGEETGSLFQLQIADSGRLGAGNRAPVTSFRNEKLSLPTLPDTIAVSPFLPLGNSGERRVGIPVLFRHNVIVMTSRNSVLSIGDDCRTSPSPAFSGFNMTIHLEHILKSA
jgi:hypothetical protein